MASSRVLQWHWRFGTQVLTFYIVLLPHDSFLRSSPALVVIPSFFLWMQRYSLIKAGVNAKIVEAFDINNIANDVYEFNFGHRPYQGNVQNLAVGDLDSYQAHAWLLSPPCQPYTRQGLQKGSEDARAFSFLKILGLIPDMLSPPILLFVENVVGFEASDTHQMMVEILEKNNFVFQEFNLSPLEFGVPYSRPRYFCLAKRKPFSFQHSELNSQILGSHELLFGLKGGKLLRGRARPCESWDEVVNSCEPLERFLSSPWNLDQYLVPENMIKRWGAAMDIVYPNSMQCCCFTKSYYRYVKGTGSLLAMSEPVTVSEGSSWNEQKLRYFSPREVANLHSFPDEFDFPHHITLRQQYALLGNSISVAVVAPLLRYLFSDPYLLATKTPNAAS